MAPTIALSGDASVDEGSLYSLTLGAVTDPGDDTVTEWTVDWGDGGRDTYLADGVVTHTYADGPADYTISVDLLDEDGTHLAAGSHDVHVDNVKPSISLRGPDTANEGDTETYTFVVIDPGVNDTQTITVDCGANGAQVGLTAYNVARRHGQLRLLLRRRPGHHQRDRHRHRLRRCSDTDNQFVTVTVANLAPVVTAAADQGSDEGQDVAFDLGSFSDAGANDADWTVDIDWGDSSSDTFDAALQGALGTLNHTYADDGLYSVEVCVTDKDWRDWLRELRHQRRQRGAGGDRRRRPESRTRARPRPLISAASAMRATTTPLDGRSWTGVTLSSDTFTDSEASAGCASTDRSHTYADNGTYSVTVTVREADGDQAPRTRRASTSPSPTWRRC